MELTKEIINDVLNEYLLNLFKGIHADIKRGCTLNKCSPNKYLIKIGNILSSNNITFNSIYDSQYIYTNNEKLTDIYIEKCKKMPNFEFINKYLTDDFQKNTLLNIVKITNLIKNDTNNEIRLKYFLNVLDKTKKIGINNQFINEEIVDIILNLNPLKFNPNSNIIPLIEKGFFFNDEFIYNSFYNNFKTWFGTLPDTLKTFHLICDVNKTNKLFFLYKKIDNELVVKNEVKKVKIKI